MERIFEAAHLYLSLKKENWDLKNSRYATKKYTRIEKKLFLLEKYLSNESSFNKNLQNLNVNIVVTIYGWSPHKRLYGTIPRKKTVRRYSRRDLNNLFGKNKYVFEVKYNFSIEDSPTYDVPWLSVQVEDLSRQKRNVELKSLLPYYQEQEVSNVDANYIGYIEKISIRFEPSASVNLPTKFLDYLLLNRIIKISKLFDLEKKIEIKRLGERLFHVFHKYSKEFKLLAAQSPLSAAILGDNNFIKLFDFADHINGSHVCRICEEKINYKFIRYFNSIFTDELELSRKFSFIADHSKNILKVSNGIVAYGNFLLKNNLSIENNFSTKIYSDLVSGRWKYSSFNRKGQGHIIVGKFKKIVLKSGFMISSKNNANWYHALIEDTPKLKYLEELDQSIPVLISSDTPKNAVILLNTICGEREIIILDTKKLYTVKELFIPKQSSWISDLNQTDTNLQNINYWLDADAINSLRSRIHSVFEKSNPDTKHLVFSGRKSLLRSIINYNSIKRLLTDRGFNILDLESMKLDQIIHNFYNAKVAVLSGGAGCANMLFMREGSTIIILYPRAARGFNLYNDLANALNINCIHLYWPSLYFKKRSFIYRLNSSYFVMPYILGKKIDELIRVIP